MVVGHYVDAGLVPVDPAHSVWAGASRNHLRLYEPGRDREDVGPVAHLKGYRVVVVVVVESEGRMK